MSTEYRFIFMSSSSVIPGYLQLFPQIQIHIASSNKQDQFLTIFSSHTLTLPGGSVMGFIYTAPKREVPSLQFEILSVGGYTIPQLLERTFGGHAPCLNKVPEQVTQGLVHLHNEHHRGGNSPGSLGNLFQYLPTFVIKKKKL